MAAASIKKKKLPNPDLLMIVSSEGCLGGLAPGLPLWLGSTAELNAVTPHSCDAREVRIGPPLFNFCLCCRA